MYRSTLPIVDISSLSLTRECDVVVAREVGEACRGYGFFYVVGHGVPSDLTEQLQRLSRSFFEHSVEWKNQWKMKRVDSRQKGYVSLEKETTSGKPDYKESLFFCSDKRANISNDSFATTFDSNSFPDIKNFKDVLKSYMLNATSVARNIVSAISLSLNLPADYIYRKYTSDPTITFRIINYPTTLANSHSGAVWGVGEHTDYGLLTIVLQDDVGGLQVCGPSGWVDAAPVRGSFICNIGDMLDFVTRGTYRSTVHRVIRNVSGRDRLSFPFFFDPSLTARLVPVPTVNESVASQPLRERWDHNDIRSFSGSYGDYLEKKVRTMLAKVE